MTRLILACTGVGDEAVVEAVSKELVSTGANGEAAEEAVRLAHVTQEDTRIIITLKFHIFRDDVATSLKSLLTGASVAVTE